MGFGAEELIHTVEEGEEGKACGRLRVTGMPGVEGARGKGGPTWRAGGPGHKCPFVEWGTGSPRRILS